MYLLQCIIYLKGDYRDTIALPFFVERSNIFSHQQSYQIGYLFQMSNNFCLACTRSKTFLQWNREATYFLQEFPILQFCTLPQNIPYCSVLITPSTTTWPIWIPCGANSFDIDYYGNVQFILTCASDLNPALPTDNAENIELPLPFVNEM